MAGSTSDAEVSYDLPPQIVWEVLKSLIEARGVSRASDEASMTAELALPIKANNWPQTVIASVTTDGSGSRLHLSGKTHFFMPRPTDARRLEQFGHEIFAAMSLAIDAAAPPSAVVGDRPEASAVGFDTSSPAAPSADEKSCPYCAEIVKATAIKCKHCGEMLGEMPRTIAPYSPEPVWRWDPREGALGGGGWRCIEHGKLICRSCRDRSIPPRQKGATDEVYPSAENRYAGVMGERKKLSEVGARASDGSLHCPRCGGTQFTAKRSNAGKVVGFTTLGVGGLVAPKSQVKCVSCGLKFKRG